MPRLSSLRSGLLLTLFLAVSGFGTFAFAQMDYAAMDAMKMGAMSGNPGAMGAAGAQQGAITNVASGIKRSGSSLGNVQALLYADAAFVMRINATKIDYEALAKFVDEFVDKAGGAVRSDDKYLVELRDYQKSNAKSSFKSLLSTIQNAFVQRCFNKKIDEIYYIVYQNDKGDSCAVLAVPTDGLSEADQKTALDAVSGFDFVSPIAVFNRYGFIVAVVTHDASAVFDAGEIQERYLAKMQEERRGSAYGSYGASNGTNNGAYGSSGASEYGSMSGGLSGGVGTPGVSMGGMSGASMDGSQNAVQNSKYPNVLGLSQKLYAEYVQEVTEAEEKAQSSARKSVLPYVRRRFEKPATAEDSAKLFDALRQVDGVALAIAVVDPNSLKSIVDKKAASKDDAVSQPFSAPGSEDADDSQASIKPLDAVSKALESENKWKTGAFALSLVGAPRLVGILNYPDAETAKSEADALKEQFTLAKTFVQGALAKASSKAEEKVDFSPLVNAVFDALQPQVQGARVAVVLDTAPIQEHAALFLALMGGTEAKPEQEQESDEIDWSLGEEKKLDDTAAPAGEEAQTPAEDDPFAEPAASDSSSKANAASDSEDDPFGADDDEEDPFGE